MGKKVKKIFKKVDPFTAKVVDPMLADAGLWNVSGINRAQEQAQAQHDAMMAQQRDIEAQSRRLQSNLATNLQGENIANVVAGGSADFASAEADPRRRRRSGGLSSSLGVPS